MSSLKAYIKTHDLFGHKIELNFNRKGSSHNTIIGGAMSILIKVIMTTYIFLLVKKLINNEDDQISSVTTSVNLQDLKVNMNETKASFVFQVFNAKDEYAPVDWNEVQKYLKFEAMNWKSNRLTQENEITPLNIRECKESDFTINNSRERFKELYSGHRNKVHLCYDQSDGQ